MTWILRRTLIGTAVGTAAVSAALAGTGTALAAPSEGPHDPTSHNSYPTVPGVASLPIPADVANEAADASVFLSDVIYAGSA